MRLTVCKTAKSKTTCKCLSKMHVSGASGTPRVFVGLTSFGTVLSVRDRRSGSTCSRDLKCPRTLSNSYWRPSYPLWHPSELPPKKWYERKHEKVPGEPENYEYFPDVQILRTARFKSKGRSRSSWNVDLAQTLASRFGFCCFAHR